MQAGSTSFLPIDSPAARIDTTLDFAYSLDIDYYGLNYSGSAVALSSEWLLTAAHNLDFNNDGKVDNGLQVNATLRGESSTNIDAFYIHPDFTGFQNPYLNDDLALLHVGTALKTSIQYPSLGSGSIVGEQCLLAGYGRSGYGNVGYTIDASLTNLRIGENIIDSVGLDDETLGFAETFYYDFDSPSDSSANGSLGNKIETMIGPGDSGGPLLLQLDQNNYELVGINTFYDGSGLFGDTAGGILIDPYIDWIEEITGITAVPEAATTSLLFGIISCLLFLRKKL